MKTVHVIGNSHAWYFAGAEVGVDVEEILQKDDPRRHPLMMSLGSEIVDARGFIKEEYQKYPGSRVDVHAAPAKVQLIVLEKLKVILGQS